MQNPDHQNLIAAAGTRALEERLLADLEDALREGSLREGPVLVIVSSGALRRHLSGLVARRLGPAVLGVGIHTLWTAASRVLQRAGHPSRTGGALFEVLVRRAAAEEPALEAPLGELEDGYGTVVSGVKDLLSAGFEAALLDGALDSLQELHPGGKRRRAEAVLRAAAASSELLTQWNLGRMNEVLAEAAQVVERQGPGALGARTILIHGFSDATGRGLDFLEGLVTRSGARLFLDLPPDPERPDETDRAANHTVVLRERLFPGATPVPEAPGPPTEWSLFDAPGTDGEIFEVAHRIKALLARDVPPERIGVVARALAPNPSSYGVAIRRHFLRLGVPFSGGRASAALAPVQRRLLAGLENLKRRHLISIDRWLDAWATSFPAQLRGIAAPAHNRPFLTEDLRMALRAIGVGHLGEAANLDISRIVDSGRDYRLPARRGLVTRGTEESATGSTDSDPIVHSPNRTLPREFLAAALEEARRCSSPDAGWDQPATLGQHAHRARAFFKERLGWIESPDSGLGDWQESLEELAGLDSLDRLDSSNDTGREFQFEEFLLLLEHAFQTLGEDSLGGEGGGVQILEVPRARHLTFDHLFIIGMNRSVFPRTVTEDALLPDTVRRALRHVLPDLQEKQRGHQEERYLFAQLTSAANHVTLSWQRVDDDGKERHPSSFVERLIHGELALKPDSLPRLREDMLRHNVKGDPERLRTARDNLQLAGILGTRKLVGQMLPLALEEAAGRFPAPGHGEALAADVIGAARLRILEEFDPDLRTPEGRKRRLQASPYLGTIAPLSEKLDPRMGSLYATRLESMATCPWKTLLQRVLRLEPVPDPLSALPSLDARLVGITVHETLQHLVEHHLADRVADLPAAIASGPRNIERPDPEAVEKTLFECAQRVARKEGLLLAGLHQVLARLASPFVERALALDWPLGESVVAVLGCELEGGISHESPSGRQWKILFKADRVDLRDGNPLLTDFKTSGPIKDLVKAEKRDEHLRRAVGSGERLQVALYAQAAGAYAAGRYMFLKPGTQDDRAVQELPADDTTVTEILPATLGRLLTAWEQGVFFPQVEDQKGDEPRACKWCEVSDACLRRDSGARRRLTERAATLREQARAGEELSPSDRSFQACWFGEDTVPDEDVTTEQSS